MSAAEKLRARLFPFHCPLPVSPPPKEPVILKETEKEKKKEEEYSRYSASGALSGKQEIDFLFDPLSFARWGLSSQDYYKDPQAPCRPLEIDEGDREVESKVIYLHARYSIQPIVTQPRPAIITPRPLQLIKLRHPHLFSVTRAPGPNSAKFRQPATRARPPPRPLPPPLPPCSIPLIDLSKCPDEEPDVVYIGKATAPAAPVVAAVTAPPISAAIPPTSAVAPPPPAASATVSRRRPSLSRAAAALIEKAAAEGVKPAAAAAAVPVVLTTKAVAAALEEAARDRNQWTKKRKISGAMYRKAKKAQMEEKKAILSQL